MWYTSCMNWLIISFLCQWQYISGQIFNTVISILVFITFVLQNVFRVILVFVSPIIVMNKLGQVILFILISLFWIPPIINTNHACIVFKIFDCGLHFYYNFTMNHMLHFRKLYVQLFCLWCEMVILHCTRVWFIIVVTVYTLQIKVTIVMIV